MQKHLLQKLQHSLDMVLSDDPFRDLQSSLKKLGLPPSWTKCLQAKSGCHNDRSGVFPSEHRLCQAQRGPLMQIHFAKASIACSCISRKAESAHALPPSEYRLCKFPTSAIAIGSMPSIMDPPTHTMKRMTNTIHPTVYWALHPTTGLCSQRSRLCQMLNRTSTSQLDRHRQVTYLPLISQPLTMELHAFCSEKMLAALLDEFWKCFVALAALQTRL